MRSIVATSTLANLGGRAEKLSVDGILQFPHLDILGPNYAKVPMRPYDFKCPIETADISSISHLPIFGDDFDLLFAF